MMDDQQLIEQLAQSIIAHLKSQGHSAQSAYRLVQDLVDEEVERAVDEVAGQIGGFTNGLPRLAMTTVLQRVAFRVGAAVPAEGLH